MLELNSLWELYTSCSKIHSFSSLTTGPKPLPKRALHIVRSRASSFKWEYPLLSLRSSVYCTKDITLSRTVFCDVRMFVPWQLCPQHVTDWLFLKEKQGTCIRVGPLKKVYSCSLPEVGDRVSLWHIPTLSKYPYIMIPDRSHIW
jgi:hypothetical protein